MRFLRALTRGAGATLAICSATGLLCVVIYVTDNRFGAPGVIAFLIVLLLVFFTALFWNTWTDDDG